MAMGVADLKQELTSGAGLTEFPEIHQFLDGFYLSRIGIRILIGQHIALHEPQKQDHIGRQCAPFLSSVIMARVLQSKGVPFLAFKISKT